MEGREQEVPHRQAHQGREGRSHPGEDSRVGRLSGHLAIEFLKTCTRKVSSVRSIDAEQEKVLIFMPLMNSYLPLSHLFARIAATVHGRYPVNFCIVPYFGVLGRLQRFSFLSLPSLP